MSKATTAIKTPQSLDVAKLEQLIEPLTITVHKIKNGQFSPIVLPEVNGQPAGMGWAKEDLLGLDSWLVNHWSGGGMYEVNVTDSTQPSPQKLTWKPFWLVSEYPERVPPTMADSARQYPQQPQQPQQQVTYMGSQFPNGLPTGGMFLPQPQAFQAPVYMPPMASQNTNFNPYLMQAEADRRRLEERLNATESALQKAQLETEKRQYQNDLERANAMHAQAMQRLEARVAELTSAPRGPNPEIEAMRVQLAEATARAERADRERESERREQLIRDQMAAQATETRRMIEAMQQQLAQATAQQNRGPDPLITMMIEQNRNAMEAMKEISRQGASGIDKFQQYMMSPRDVMAMQRENSSGLDTVSEKLTKVYDNVLGMHQKVLENALQLNQGGNETVGLIRDGITSAKEAFERYVGAKSKQAQVEEQSKAQAVTATAQAQAIQAQAQVEVARIHNMPQPIQQPQPQPQPARPQPQPQSGLGGAPSVANFAEWKAKQEAAQVSTVASHAAGTQTPSGQHVPTPGNAPQTVQLRRGRTDQDWFGPTLGEVLQVRIAVQQFLAGLETGKYEGATPEAVADGILQAHALVMMNGIPVPAMVELLNQGLYAEFVEVLLPDVKDTLREDIVKILKKKLDGDDGESDEDDDGDEPEDGEHHDDVRDGEVDKPKPRVRIVNKPSARA